MRLTQCSVVAVSAGAVLRALNKANGPKRLIQSSYGFLRREPHEPKVYTGHKHARSYQDPENEDWYVEVINYFLLKVSSILIQVSDRVLTSTGICGFSNT